MLDLNHTRCWNLSITMGISNYRSDYIYGTMSVVGDNIKKILPKWMYWKISITVVSNTKNIVNFVKVNQAMVEKWMLSQPVKELLELYVSMPKGTVTKVMHKQIEAIYLTYGEDDQEVRHFSNIWKTHVWKFLRECVYICCPSWNFFWVSKRKTRIYNFLFFRIHVNTG